MHTKLPALALLLAACATAQPLVHPPEPPPEGRLPGPPGKDEIVRGMGTVKFGVAHCYAQYKVGGMVMMHTTLADDGNVADVVAQGDFAGTPTGRCVEDAVRQARFQQFTGGPFTFDYPFMLR